MNVITIIMNYYKKTYYDLEYKHFYGILLMSLKANNK